MRFSARPAATLLVAAIVLLAGCGGDDSADTTTADTEAAAATTMAAGTAAPAPGGDEAAEGVVGTDAQRVVASVDPSALGRSIVYTASLGIEVDDVISAGEQAQAAVAGLGGVLFGQETTTGSNPRSVLTIKVPPENFREALGRLAGIGKLLSQQVFADDVTERVVDLESRITTAEASVQRLRSFLEIAEGVEAVAQLEGQLLERETALELLRGQLRTLENQVALATIVLVLTEPTPPTPEPAIELVQTAYVGHDDGAGCPGAENLRLDEGDQLTVCFEVTNTGDTGLIDIEVRDRGLKADEDDLVVIEGDLESILEPDGRLILMLETEADPKRSTDPTIQATAVDSDGEPIRRTVEVESDVLSLRVDEDESLPGFGDAMREAWGGVQWLFGVAVILAGVLVPFVWVPVLVFGGFWFIRRRRSGNRRMGKAADTEPAGAKQEPEPEGIDPAAE